MIVSRPVRVTTAGTGPASAGGLSAYPGFADRRPLNGSLLIHLCLEVEKIAASGQTLNLGKEDVLKELLPSDLSSPTGIR